MDVTNQPSKEDIIEYYINQNHTKQECADYFGYSWDSMSRRIKKFGIVKEADGHAQTKQKQKEKHLKELITQVGTKEQVYNYYIIENHSIQECMLFFNICKDTFLKVLKYYQIAKSCPDFIRDDRLLSKRRNLLNISSEELCKLYIDQNLTLSQIAEKFGCTATAVFKKLKKYDIEKGEQQTIKKREEVCFQKYGKINSLQIGQFKEKSYEDEIIKILSKEFNIKNIVCNCKDILPSGKEIDIYLPDYKIGIEFNSDYWHCDIHEKFQDHNGRSTYHQNKSIEAKNQGIFLFHIFEHEWSEDWFTDSVSFENSRQNILNRLRTLFTKNSKKIPARKCVVKEISKEEKKIFLDNNHIQGNENHGSYALGLFYENTLVACMCFGHSKFRKYNYELTRFASLHDTNVQGGASKLFNYFVHNKMQSGEKVVSYNDITKTKGAIYQTLGFECLSINDPNYWWVKFENCDIRSRYQEQAAGEVERMHSQGYHRICDCGTKTWIYIKK